MHYQNTLIKELSKTAGFADSLAEAVRDNPELLYGGATAGGGLLGYLLDGWRGAAIGGVSAPTLLYALSHMGQAPQQVQPQPNVNTAEVKNRIKQLQQRIAANTEATRRENLGFAGRMEEDVTNGLNNAAHGIKEWWDTPWAGWSVFRGAGDWFKDRAAGAKRMYDAAGNAVAVAIDPFTRSAIDNARRDQKNAQLLEQVRALKESLRDNQ